MIQLNTKKKISLIVIIAIIIGIGSYYLGTNAVGNTEPDGRFRLEKGDYLEFNVSGVAIVFGSLDGTMRWKILEETEDTFTIQTKYTDNIAKLMTTPENFIYGGSGKQENIYVTKDVTPKEDLWSGTGKNSLIDIGKTRENGNLVGKKTITTEMGKIPVSHYKRIDNENRVNLYFEENLKIPIKVSADIGNMASLTITLKDTNIEEILDKFQ